jgi:hypothetical protein
MGGGGATYRTRQKVIQLMEVLDSLGIRAAWQFMEIPVYDNNPRFHTFLKSDGTKGKTRY